MPKAKTSLLLPSGGEHPLRDQARIGRAEGNDLVLADRAISRLHAVLNHQGGRWFIADCGSFNGTLLNGIRLHPGTANPLRHGDRIGLGSMTLVFSSPSQLEDAERTDTLEGLAPASASLSPYQRQVVACLCERWLKGGRLEDLPSNEEIAARLGTPDAVASVKASLRRAYAKAGLSAHPPFAKRQALCQIARQRNWI